MLYAHLPVGIFAPNIESPEEKTWVQTSLSDLASEGIDPVATNTDIQKIKAVYKNYSFLTILEKLNEEDVDGAPTYHYKFDIDKTSLNAFLEEAKKIPRDSVLAGRIGDLQKAASLSDMTDGEIWIGKLDMLPRKVKLSLHAKDITTYSASGKISLSMQFFDYNKPVQIETPGDAISIKETIKKSHAKEADAKIKEYLSLIKGDAEKIFASETHYGPASNSSGSCTNPALGSLFTPKGHNEEKQPPYKDIEDTILKAISLSETPGEGDCYSSRTAYAVAIRLMSTPDTYWCIDSNGASGEITKKLSSSTCEQ